MSEQDNRIGDLSHYEVVESIKLIGSIWGRKKE